MHTDFHNELTHAIAQAIDSVHVGPGWDFARVRDDVDPLPWSYRDVVRHTLTPGARVLDLGTGGGEMFLRLAAHFAHGVGIDRAPAMLAAARTHRPAELADRVAFVCMDAGQLAFPAESFDVVLCHHAAVDAGEVVRVLRPGGYFITQQVGSANHHTICAALAPDAPPPGAIPAYAVGVQRAALAALGCDIRREAAYNVPYYYRDIESLVYWLKALNFPPNLNADDHGDALRRLVQQHSTPRGIRTNVHRELLIVCKPGAFARPRLP